jgi:hypothetical protein
MRRMAVAILVVGALAMSGCEPPCVQPPGQSVFTRTLTPAERAVLPAGDGTYYGARGCETVCRPAPSEGGVASDAGVSAFNRVNCTVRGMEIDCQFQFVCGG